MRIVASTPRKLAQAGIADGCRRVNATDIIPVTRAWRMHRAVTTNAVRYVGTLGAVETGATGSVGDVALGKYITKSKRLIEYC